MRFSFFASPIILFCCLVLLSGCSSIGLHDPFAEDQVPPEVKAAPLIVQRPVDAVETAVTPRLGDVPFKPRDFSPKPVYDHYMDELEFDRAEGEKAKAQTQTPAAAPDNGNNPADGVTPPQLPSAHEP